MSATITPIAPARAERARRDLEQRATATARVARDRALRSGLAAELADRIAHAAASAVRSNGLSPGAALARRGCRPRGTGPEAA